MEISKQVCTLEQAKRLKELGVKQESYFYWWSHWIPMEQRIGETLGANDESDKVNPKYSAFTVAELGELLPKWYFTFKRSNGCYGCYRSDSGIFQRGIGIRGKLSNQDFDTEAEARAAILIYLLEQKII